jgi:hypothetical protein
MELTNVTNRGNLMFKLDDGRMGGVYKTGYVRVEVKGRYGSGRMYQINKKNTIRRKIREYTNDVLTFALDTENYTRDLIHDHAEQISRLMEFNLNNCQAK